jgi:hypothetical protein
MAKLSALDHQWQALMTLCASEGRFKADGTHPKLLKLVAAEIDELAAEMGFSERVIATREFRAERDNGRIVRILKG